MENPETQAALGTRHRIETNKINHNTNNKQRGSRRKKHGLILVLPKGRLFLFFIRHPSCYSSTGPVQILSVIEERKIYT